MSVTTCLLAHMGAKSPIAAYRRDMAEDVAELVADGMTTEAAWLKVAGDKLTELKAERSRIEQVVADAYAKTAAGKPADAAPAEVATHKDPGEPAEVVTPAVVAESVKTAAARLDRKPSEMRDELLAKVDAALQEAPDYEDFQTAVKSLGEKDAIAAFTDAKGTLGEKRAPTGFSRPTRTFDVAGDGKFTVNNTVRQLLTFRRSVETSHGFKDSKTPKPPLAREATGEKPSPSVESAIKSMIDEGDAQAAVDFADFKGVDIKEVLKGDKVRLPKIAWLTPTTEATAEEAAATREPEPAQPEDQAEPAKGEAPQAAAMPPIAGIPRDVAQRAHEGTSHVPEQRALQEQHGFTATLTDAWNRAARAAGQDQAAIDRITEAFKDVADGYRQRYMAALGARSRVMSSMIAGPARFPVERNRKRSETAHKRSEEASEYLQRGIKRLLRAARGPIDNSPASELERVRQNLTQREEDQEQMKAANAALRKGDDEALRDLGYTDEQIAELKKPDFAGRKGFPDYKLTNNNAEIRRLRERLTDAEARMAAAEAGPVESERQGVRMVEDAADDRLRLIFDGKPSEAVREDLKANGFKWSPKNEAWQRQLTDNARRAAKTVMDKHFPADDAGNTAMFSIADEVAPEYTAAEPAPKLNQPGELDPAVRSQGAGNLRTKLDAAGLDRGYAEPDTSAYEPAGNADTAAAERFAATFNRGKPRSDWVVLDAVAPRASSQGGRSRELAAVSTAAKRLFGHRVVFVKFQGRPLFNGAVDRNEPGVIFINADSQRPMMAVLGHELLHKLRNEREDLYRDLVRRLGRVMKNQPDYYFDLDRKYKAAKLDTPQEWLEELHADIVGDNFTDPQFWRDMAAEQPGLFKRVAQAILRFLDDVAESLRGVRTFGTERYLTDIDAARSAVVSAMRQFSENQTEPMADAVEGIRLSAADRPDQTDTPAFRKWFGDSKVVDADGKPLVVYHGTTRNFADFDGGRASESTGAAWSYAGHFFTEDAGLASAFTKGKRWTSERAAFKNGGNVMPVYLSMQNPMRVPASRMLPMSGSAEKVKALRAEAEAAGHDGIIIAPFRDSFGFDDTTNELRTPQYIAFRPEQIKSAIGNRGTFDAGNPDIRLSIADTLQGQEPERAVRTAQDLVNTKGGVFDFNRLGETRQDRLRTVLDGSRPFWLGALTRDQIADIYGKEIAPVKEYDDLTRAMENERSKMAGDADTLYSEWAKLDQKDNDRLARIMLDGTVHQVHPDRPFEPGGENDEERRRVHGMISTQYKLLPPEAKAMYGKVRDFHLGTLTKLRDALEARIERQVESGSARAAALTSIRATFDKYLGSGPYFPLSRFGDFLVVANRDDGERVVASYATAGEQQAAARKLESDGFTVKMKTAKTYSRETDGAAGKFIGDVLTAVDKLDMEDANVGGQAADLKNKLLDDINQLFIKALPDLSYRKHFMHRKGTPGFSSDVMRGFASSAFHAASHIARLNHGDKMTFALQDAYSAIENAPEGDFNQHSQVLNELTRRHEAAMNPNTHPIAAMLNQVGFIMYLGMSPAAGLVNMLQTVMVTMPHLGARYGFGKANGSLATAYKDILAAPMNAKNGWNAAQSQKLTTAERAMMTQLQDEGVIDLTQAHDLASATNLDTGNVARSKAAFAMAKAMKIVGWTFHIPEVMNRQVTALSAYRLEMEKSGDEDAAKDAAREAIKRTHFDYSASNRARFMSGDIARVVTQFKQYSQNMTYLLGRAAYQMLKGESPEVRAIARRQLLATLGVTFGMAGALGLPGLGGVMGLLGLLAGAMSDDDEPWDWEVEFRNLMADSFGKEVGEVISHGIPRALMPWDISNRIGLGDLWWRDSGRAGDNPREAWAAAAQSILGPTAGTTLGLFTAADHMARGNWSKAAENVVPKALRDPLKALREGQEGITNYNGEPLLDVDGLEVMGRALGFAPARASEMFEARNAVKNAETVLNEKRQRLLSRMVKARMDLDTVAIVDLQDDINEFNRRNPEFRITSDSIMKSVRAKRRNLAETEDGIRLPKGKESLRELGRFAEVD